MVGSDRHRADRVVGTVVAADFVNRQQLDKFESTFRQPVDELPQRRDIANPKIVFAAQSKERRQNTGDLFPATNSSLATESHG